MFLAKSYEDFVNTTLYDRDNISVSNVKDIIQSKELKRYIFGFEQDGVKAELVMSSKDMNNDKYGGGRGKSHSK